MSDQWTAEGQCVCKNSNQVLTAYGHGASKQEAYQDVLANANQRCLTVLGTPFDEWITGYPEYSQPEPGLINWGLDAVDGPNSQVRTIKSPTYGPDRYLWKFKLVQQIGDKAYWFILSKLGGVLDACNGTGPLYLHPTPDANNDNHLWELVDADAPRHLIISKRTGGALDGGAYSGTPYLHPTPTQDNPNHEWVVLQHNPFTTIRFLLPDQNA
jgi:hypothetical protein